MDKTIAPDYIRASFREDDRLAVVLIQKSTVAVTQRIANVDRITSEPFQAWLRYMNSQRHEVYISMNALHSDARGRTKADVTAVRHVYLDFDKDGPEAIRALRAREDVPTPNDIIQSSEGKYQAVWKVEQFEKEKAEALMRRMVRELGADPAATDSARVLRVPGYFNHKYGTPQFVSVEHLTKAVYTPAHFPSIPDTLRSQKTDRETSVRTFSKRPQGTTVSQSERDWSFALRALARGDDPKEVASAIAVYRPDKPNPRNSAERTVQKAMSVLSAGVPHGSRPDRGPEH